MVEDPGGSTKSLDGTPVTSPAHNAGSGRGEPTVVDASTYLCALIDNDDADPFESLTRDGNADDSTSEWTSNPRETTRVRQWSQRNKRNPLDTTAEPLQPTSAITLAAAAVADAAHNAAKAPNPPSEPILPRDTEEKPDRWLRHQRHQDHAVRSDAACMRPAYRNTARKNKTRRHATAPGFDLV
ncbi:hypothetical protein AAVH_41512 [Aphelenchoides avenae]|nr:hypothetical protein AAVH_41512 [Aphelenchus avenae]